MDEKEKQIQEIQSNLNKLSKIIDDLTVGKPYNGKIEMTVKK